MIRTSLPIRYSFPPHKLTSDFCQGNGLEIGAAAHNSFNLPGALNVAPALDPADFEFYQNTQLELAGAYALVDIDAEAHAIPVPDHSQDYVVSSHVVEHLPNLIAAFIEWNRVLRPGGVVSMIFPHREALPEDIGRPVTPLDHFFDDFRSGATVETHDLEHVSGGRRGHYHVFTLDSMLALIARCNLELGLGWLVVAVEPRDTKVGNGHCVIASTQYLCNQTLI